MLYLYDENTLKPLRRTPFDAINVAKLSDSILVSTKIDETVLIASKVVSLISFGYYRLIPFPQTKKKEASL